jgi:Flp pilus assembly protein TadB
MALLGCGVGLGVVLALIGWRGTEVRRSAQPLSSRLPARRILAALAGMVLTWLVTGWPIAGVLVAAAVFGLPALYGATAARAVVAEVEAVAAWTEMLRDVLAASAGLGQAITVTAPLAPLPIRNEVEVLSARLAARVPLSDALRALATDLRDPSADLVIAALVMAAEARGQRLAELLSALADAAREEVSMRLRIETSRAQVRASVRAIAGFSLAFAALVAILARSYLAPFGTALGQVVLAMVGLLYAGGLALLVHMARPRPAPRLLIAEAER